MSRVALVAPVLSTAVPDLSRLLRGDPYAVRDELARDFGEWRALRPAVPPVPALIHGHEAVGASLLPDRLLVAERAVPAAAAAHGVQQVLASVGLHGVAALVLWVEVADLGRLATAEENLCHLIPVWAAEVHEHLVSSPAVERLAVGRIGRYPVDSFLYWHRLLQDPPAPGGWGSLLCNDVEVDLAGAAQMRLGDGYSLLADAADDVARDVLRGLLRAQELWLTVTTVSQQLLLEIARLTQPEDLPEAELAAEQEHAIALADREALRNGVIRDEITYTTGSQRAVLQAATRAWQLELDTTRVARRLDVLLHVLGRRIGEQQSRRQEKLNAIVLALTVVGALALVLGLFETSVGDGLPSLDPTRVAVSLVVGSLAFASLLLALRSGRPGRLGDSNRRHYAPPS